MGGEQEQVRDLDLLKGMLDVLKELQQLMKELLIHAETQEHLVFISYTVVQTFPNIFMRNFLCSCQFF